MMRTPTPLQHTILGLTACALWLTACSEDVSSPPPSPPAMNQGDQGPDQRPTLDMAQPDQAPAADMEEMTSEPDMPAVVDMSQTPDLVEDMAVDMAIDPKLLDSDYDRISDYDESLICTDPNNFDTDGDLINDYEELQLNTNPCDPDTDGDGLNDEREIYFGFNPNKPSTYDDGILDQDRYIVSACDTPASEPVGFYKNSSGDWNIGLPPALNSYVELTINSAQSMEAAAVYDDPTNEVSGFIFSSANPAQNSALATMNAYERKLELAGLISDRLSGGEFNTHDGFKAAPGDYTLTLSGMSARAARDQLLFMLSSFNPADVSGLPSSAGNTHSKFIMKLSVIRREDRLITSLAIAPEQLYNTRDQVKFRLSDLTNTTNVSQANDGNELRCHQFPANIEIPEADFYWVLDQSGSMDSRFRLVQSFADDFYAQLLNTTLDFRLGVTNMDKTLKGRLRPNVAWHTDPATFRDEIQTYVIGCQGCNYTAESEEHGLYVAREGITYMRGSSAPLNQRMRAKAQLATIFITDEDDQSIKDGKDPNGPSIGAAALTTQYANFFANNPLAFTINGEGIQANGTRCGDRGVGYEQAALASGGATASLCDTDLAAIISQILDIVAGRASTFRLPQTPISSTLRVYLGDETDPTQGRWVPRSRQDGFDYFPQSNSIAFFGSYRPNPANDRGVQVAVHYRSFVDRTK